MTSRTTRQSSASGAAVLWQWQWQRRPLKPPRQLRATNEVTVPPVWVNVVKLPPAMPHRPTEQESDGAAMDVAANALENVNNVPVQVDVAGPQIIDDGYAALIAARTRARLEYIARRTLRSAQLHAQAAARAQQASVA